MPPQVFKNGMVVHFPSFRLQLNGRAYLLLRKRLHGVCSRAIAVYWMRRTHAAGQAREMLDGSGAIESANSFV